MKDMLEKDKVFEVIDKHMSYHKERMLSLAIDKIIGLRKEEDILSDADASSSALAALEMLKNELNGDVEY